MSAMWHTTLDRIEQQLEAMAADLSSSDSDAFLKASEWLQRIARALVEWSASEDARHTPPDERAVERLQAASVRLRVLRQALAQRQSRVEAGLGLLVPNAAPRSAPTYGAKLVGAGAVQRSPYQSATTSSGTWATARV